jgi:hypothetical protein
MSDSKRVNGVSPAFLLFLVFLVLRLTHVINWSWWWVTCPLWFWFAVAAVFFLVPCIGAAVVAVVAFVGVFVYQFIKNIFKRK